MKLFLLFTDLWSKNFFYNIFSISTKEFKIDFQHRKLNYPNRKWNYFSHSQASDPKTSFTDNGYISPYLIINTLLRWHLPCNIRPGDICHLSRINAYLILLIRFWTNFSDTLLSILHLGFSARLKIWQVSNCNIILTL